jgi:hypothetical protein
MQLPSELSERCRPARAQGSDDRPADLPEGAVEWRLSPPISHRSRARSAERTPLRERTSIAARGRPAHIPAEVHQGLVPAARIGPIDARRRRLVYSNRWYTVRAEADPPHDPSDVRVDRRNNSSERDRCDRRRGVRPYPRQRSERVGVRRDVATVASDQLPRRGVQRDRPPVVAEGPPRSEHVSPRRGRQDSDVRKHIDEPLEGRSDARGLRLLQHDLADQDPVWIGAAPPRIPVRPGPVPLQQGVFHGSRLAG